MRKDLLFPALLVVSVCSADVSADGYYVCQDPKTGKKVGQDFPCRNSKEIGSYAPVSPEELKARDEKAWQSRREFERQNPGTYRPEEVMTEEEFATYQVKRRAQEDERRKLEQEQAARDAAQRAERAEQRAAEAERAAREAEARAAEAAARASPYPYLVAPRPLPIHPGARPKPTPMPCIGPDCLDTPGKPRPAESRDSRGRMTPQ